MDRDRFRRLVQRAVRSLPREFADRLDNLDIVIEREPARWDLRLAYGGGQDATGSRELFGLYVGTPLTDRSSAGEGLPDRIVIFQGPLQRHVHPRDLPEEIRRTVVHELAHHFGIDDARLDELGLA